MNLSDLQNYANNRNVRALLDTIAYGEGANYNTYFGGGSFNTNGPHPCRVVAAGNYHSTAAGRYQFLCNTWNSLVKRYGFATMSPANQDLAAIALISDNGGLQSIVNGNFQGAVNAIRNIWPSLPGGSQQTRTWQQATSFFANAGGNMGAPPATSPNVAQTANDYTNPVAADDSNGAVVTSDYFGEQSMVSPTVLLISAAGIVLYLLFRD